MITRHPEREGVAGGTVGAPAYNIYKKHINVFVYKVQ